MNRLPSATGEALLLAEEDIMEVSAVTRFIRRYLDTYKTEEDARWNTFYTGVTAQLSEQYHATLEAQGYLSLARLHCQIEIENAA